MDDVINPAFATDGPGAELEGAGTGDHVIPGFGVVGLRILVGVGRGGSAEDPAVASGAGNIGRSLVDGGGGLGVLAKVIEG